MINKVLWESTTRTGDYFGDMIILAPYDRLCLAKKMLISNYKINICMTDRTLNIYIYDTQHL